MRRRRRGSDNNLSFLDVVSCGFGAIVLLILITKPADGPPAEDFSRLIEWLRGQLAAAVEQAMAELPALKVESNDRAAG